MLTKNQMINRISVNEIQLGIKWSDKMTKIKAKIYGNCIRLSSILITDANDLNATVSKILSSENLFIDDDKKIWIKGKKIGSGGFSNVFGCKNNDKAAIKIYKRSNDVINELKAYKFLGNDTNLIPKLLGSGTNGDGTDFLILEKFETNLNSLIINGYLNETKSKNIARDVIASIEYIHGKDKLHLDLKPHNVFVNVNLRSVLGDFGLLSEIGSDRVKRWGTLNYMSVDAHDKIKPTRRSDLESLGWVFIELFGYALPWKNKDLLHEEIRMTKIKIKRDDDYLARIPKYLTSFLRYVWRLEHEQVPNYDLIKSFFNDSN